MDNPFLATSGEVGNVVLDLDGVVFLGSGAIEGAGSVLRRLSSQGWRVIFATNNGTRSRQYVVDRISDQTGFEPEPQNVITSAIAAASMLTALDTPVYVVGESGLRETLEGAGVSLTHDPSQARAVVTALDREFSYTKLEAASTAIRNGARFVATNSDTTFPTPTGQVPGAGSIVAAIAAASGGEPEFAGKPHQPMIDAVTAVLGPGPTWMIGDRPETDLAFAVAAGWRSVLTLTGVTSDPGSIPAEWAPDMVVAALGELLG